MLKISEFSRLCQLPAKTLRYYDEIGLLKPMQVDPWTGYRLYSVEQLPRLNRILALKALGLSLEQIGQMLDDDLSAEQIRGMLRLRRSEIQERLREEQLRLSYVEARLQLIEQEGKMSDYEVVLKPIPSVHVATMHSTAPSMDEIGQYIAQSFGKLLRYVGQNGGRLTETPPIGITVYHNTDSEPLEFQVAVGVATDVTPSNGVTMEELPAIPQAATVVHRGSLSGIQNAYGALFEWMEANGYVINGATRDVNLHYEPDGDPSRYVTEIQFPVAKQG